MSSISYCPACHHRSPGYKKLCNHCRWIKHTLHIDPAAIYHLNTLQAGRCKLCGEFPPRNTHLCIDRNATEVRGLLCRRCHQSIASLGILHERLNILQRAAEYLTNASPRIHIQAPRRRPSISAYGLNETVDNG